MFCQKSKTISHQCQMPCCSTQDEWATRLGSGVPANWPSSEGCSWKRQADMAGSCIKHTTIGLRADASCSEVVQPLLKAAQLVHRGALCRSICAKCQKSFHLHFSAISMGFPYHLCAALPLLFMTVSPSTWKGNVSWLKGEHHEHLV